MLPFHMPVIIAYLDQRVQHVPVQGGSTPGGGALVGNMLHS
jgi:hypothetical protein